MNTPTLVVILLTVLSILVFLKTVPFIFLSSDMLNLDKYFGINIEPRLDLFDPNDTVQNLLSFMFVITIHFSLVSFNAFPKKLTLLIFN